MLIDLNDFRRTHIYFRYLSYLEKSLQKWGKRSKYEVEKSIN